jgi:hypothetical protein
VDRFKRTLLGIASVFNENFTENGFGESFFILVKDSHIIGYASKEPNPFTGEHMVIIDSRYSIVAS